MTAGLSSTAPASSDVQAVTLRRERATPLAVHLAGLVVVASVVAVDPGGWYPFVVAKGAAVALAVVAGWMALAAADRSRLPRFVAVIFGSLVAVLVAAAVFGRDPIYAWTGTPERQLGVVTWALFGAALLLGTSINTASRRRMLARWVVVAVGWSVVYGLAEFIGWDPIVTNATTARITGPYGSASMFGAALCLFIPVAFGLSVDADEQREWRWAATVAASSATAMVVVTGTRAAWVGLGVAACLGLCRGRRASRAALRVLPTAAIGLAAGLIGAALAGGVTERTAGGTSRLAEWAVGWRIIAAHPWLGVGPEGYRTALADGVTASYEQNYGRATTPDRAHNALLDVGAAGGLLAMILYASLIAIVVWAAWRVVRSRQAQPVTVALALAAVAYATQQMFLFPVSTIDPVWWIMVGATFVAAWPTPPRPGASKPTLRLFAGGAALTVLMVNGLLAVAADRAARAAVDSNDLGAAERAIELRPDVVRYRVLATRLEPNTIAGRRAAVDHMDAALRVSPDDPIIEQAHGDAVLRLAISTSDPGDIEAAVSVWRELTRDDVNCYHCWLAFGYANALDGEAEMATQAFGRAAGLAPDGDDEAQSAIDALAARSGTQSTPASNDSNGTDGDG